MFKRFSWLGAVCLCLVGCRSVPPPRVDSQTDEVQASRSNANLKTNVAVHLPRHPYAFTLCQKLNPVWWFGNADEPAPPDWYRPGKRARTLMWHLRNSCHNFTWYVIGIADKPFIRVGKYPARVSNPNGGWNWAVCEYKQLRLPFVDYDRGRFEFYCGWRNAGNFGMKLNFLQEREKKKVPQGVNK